MLEEYLLHGCLVKIFALQKGYGVCFCREIRKNINTLLLKKAYIKSYTSLILQGKSISR